jgi:hypothetical protein
MTDACLCEALPCTASCPLFCPTSSPPCRSPLLPPAARACAGVLLPPACCPQGHYGVWLDASFDHGMSRPNATYAAPCLASDQTFAVGAPTRPLPPPPLAPCTPRPQY